MPRQRLGHEAASLHLFHEGRQGRSCGFAPAAAAGVDSLATALSNNQGCLFSFTVTWLVTDRGLELVGAGGVFAAMQAAGVVERLALGCPTAPAVRRPTW